MAPRHCRAARPIDTEVFGRRGEDRVSASATPQDPRRARWWPRSRCRNGKAIAVKATSAKKMICSRMFKAADVFGTLGAGQQCRHVGRRRSWTRCRRANRAHVGGQRHRPHFVRAPGGGAGCRPRRRKGGSSSTSRRSRPMSARPIPMSLYAASKGALDSLSRGLGRGAGEGMPWQRSCPGRPTPTSLGRRAGSSPAARPHGADGQVGTADEIASAMSVLCRTMPPTRPAPY